MGEIRRVGGRAVQTAGQPRGQGGEVPSVIIGTGPVVGPGAGAQAGGDVRRFPFPKKPDPEPDPEPIDAAQTVDGQKPQRGDRQQAEKPAEEPPKPAEATPAAGHLSEVPSLPRPGQQPPQKKRGPGPEAEKKSQS